MTNKFHQYPSHVGYSDVISPRYLYVHELTPSIHPHSIPMNSCTTRSPAYPRSCGQDTTSIYILMLIALAVAALMICVALCTSGVYSGLWRQETKRFTVDVCVFQHDASGSSFQHGDFVDKHGDTIGKYPDFTFVPCFF